MKEYYDEGGLLVTECFKCEKPITVADTAPHESEHLATGTCCDHFVNDDMQFLGWICEDCGDAYYQEGRASLSMSGYTLYR